MNPKTKRYYRTMYGLHTYADVEKCLTACIAGVATQEQIRLLWALLRVVFGEADSRPPGPFGGDETR